MAYRFSLPTLNKPPSWGSQTTPLLVWLVSVFGVGVGSVVAYLLVSGKWHFALALILSLPGLIILHRYPYLALLGWLFLGPFLLHTTSNAERQIYWIIHRGLPFLTVVIILVSSKLGIRKRYLPSLGIPELAMAGYLAFGVLSILLQSGTPQATLYLFYDRVFSPMCLYLIIRLTIPGEQEWRWLLPVLFFLAFSQSVIGILSWVAPSVLPSKWLDKVGERTTGTLINPSIYTTALFFAGVLLLHGALQMKRGLLRFGFMAVFLLSFFCIFIAFSRASWLAGLVVVMGLVYVYPKYMIKLSTTVLILGLLFGSIFLPPYIEQARQRLFSDQAKGSALDRLPGFLAAYRMFQEKPLFGWGYGNFDLYDRQFMGRVLDFANDNKDHASHNWYLSTLAEQGLVGTALFFAPVGWWLLLTLRHWSQFPKRGAWNRKFLILLWLIVLAEVIINNFMNMIIFFGHGLWWIILGLIANVIAGHQLPDSSPPLHKKLPVWEASSRNRIEEQYVQHL